MESAFNLLTKSIHFKPAHKQDGVVKKPNISTGEKLENDSVRRRRLHIYAHGSDVPAPTFTFEEMSTRYHISERILGNLRTMGFEQPTPVQMQTVPLMLSGREMMACAPTGSGKTLAFLLPIVHSLGKPKKLGFRALLLSPTKELAKQTFRVCEELCAGLKLRVKLLPSPAELATMDPIAGQVDILITTPNRLVYCLKGNTPLLQLNSVEFLVIDECDKLFEDGKTGFRDQLADIYRSCEHPALRRSLFSATFAHDVEQWCLLNLDNVVQVQVGGRNQSISNISQRLIFCGNESGKLLELRRIVREELQPPVLVFVQSKDRAKELHAELQYCGVKVDSIHADKSEAERDTAVTSFRLGHCWVLVCTELLGRGLDFKAVRLVINYDFPTSAVAYIHRVGRTGRAGQQGSAITFYTHKDMDHVRSIASVIKQAGCDVPAYLLTIPKTKKSDRKRLARQEVRRESIRTLPKRELRKIATKRKSIAKAKRLEEKKAKKALLKQLNNV